MPLTLAAVGEAIGQVLPFGVGVSLSPIPIIAVELMLTSKRARSNGPAFIVGWIIGLSLVGAIVLLVSSGADASDSGAPADWVSVLKLVLGLLLLLVAYKQWRGRPQGDETAERPKWMETINDFHPPKALAFGALLSGLNPKNLILIVGAAAAIAQTGIDAGEQAIALAVFVVIGTLGPGIPVGIYLWMGDRAEPILASIKDWMGRNNAAIMAVLCLVIGAKLIGDAISGLA